jgi:hypothetical protein
MSDDSVLLVKAREAIRAGNLPRCSPDKIWAGPATGVRCDVCGESTNHGETELELEFASDGRSDPVTHHAHARCFSAFRRESEPVAERGGSDPQQTAESVDNGARRTNES